MNAEKEKQAIQTLRSFQPKSFETEELEPYYLCYSGGKDSDVILALAKLADVKYEAVHNLTTVDAPETINYIKQNPDVRIDYPDTTMWRLIVNKRMPPTRLVRYCCEELKERGGKNRRKITGVRWVESINRKNNQGKINIAKSKKLLKWIEEAGLDLDYSVNKNGGVVLNDDNDESRAVVDHCYRTRSVMVNPIIDWSDEDVWEFLCHYGIEVNPLYEVKKVENTYLPCGKQRVGCIGCPMQGGVGMKAEFIKYPRYRDNYLRAFDRMLEARKAAGLENIGAWDDARSVMMWWVGDDPRQLSLFGEPEYLKGACL